jgi:hypothetical protein
VPGAGEVIKYSVKHSSSLIKCPSHVHIGDCTAHDADTEQQGLNSLQIEVQPIGTGLYPDRIMLTSTYDLRIIDVEISARELGHTFTLNFHTQARQQTVQQIPLINGSNAPVAVVATVRTPRAIHLTRELLLA